MSDWPKDMYYSDYGDPPFWLAKRHYPTARDAIECVARDNTEFDEIEEAMFYYRVSSVRCAPCVWEGEPDAGCLEIDPSGQMNYFVNGEMVQHPPMTDEVYDTLEPFWRVDTTCGWVKW